MSWFRKIKRVTKEGPKNGQNFGWCKTGHLWEGGPIQDFGPPLWPKKCFKQLKKWGRPKIDEKIGWGKTWISLRGQPQNGQIWIWGKNRTSFKLPGKCVESEQLMKMKLSNSQSQYTSNQQQRRKDVTIVWSDVLCFQIKKIIEVRHSRD